MRFGAVLPRTYLLAALAVGPILTPVVPLASRCAAGEPGAAGLRRRPGADRARVRGQPRSGSGRSCGSRPSSIPTATASTIACSSTSRGQRQTETEGLKVPVIYESSPYFAGTSGNRQFLWNVKQEVGATPPPRTSQPAIAFKPDREQRLELARRDVGAARLRGRPLGRAGHGAVAGLRRPSERDPEQLAPKAVIDWLNGRAKGFTTIDGTEEVTATWSTGKVGMTGTSYNGTIPLAAAVDRRRGPRSDHPGRAEHVLLPLLPLERPRPPPWRLAGRGHRLSLRLHQQRRPGAARVLQPRRIATASSRAARDRATGDYNDFWARARSADQGGTIKAAVFMSHAFNDWNVVPEHSVRIYEALKGTVSRCSAYFHQGGHGGAPPLEMMNKWFTRYLYGVRERRRAASRRRGSCARQPTTAASRHASRRLPRTPDAAGPCAYRRRSLADYPNPAGPVRPPARGRRSHRWLTLDPRRGQARETLVDNVEFGGRRARERRVRRRTGCSTRRRS